MGGRNLVRALNIVVAAIFDSMTEWRLIGESRLGRVEIVTLTVGARANAPSPLALTCLISSSLLEVSTWRFRQQIARSKKTSALQARILLTHFSKLC